MPLILRSYMILKQSSITKKSRTTFNCNSAFKIFGRDYPPILTNSISKIKVLYGGMSWPAPLSP